MEDSNAPATAPGGQGAALVMGAVEGGETKTKRNAWMEKRNAWKERRTGRSGVDSQTGYTKVARLSSNAVPILAHIDQGTHGALRWVQKGEEDQTHNDTLLGEPHRSLPAQEKRAKLQNQYAMAWGVSQVHRCALCT
eukprot:EG_transcript_25484